MSFVAAALALVLLFLAASLIAAYAYGAFAEASRGAPAYALPRGTTNTQLDTLADRLCEGRGAGSGLALISSNLDAFAARALSARAAGRSLDIMYYIWHDDLTGRMLLSEVLDAADRGVRVRLLVDDIGASLSDRRFLAVDRHPNVEVRMFNPTHSRESTILRGLEMALRMVSVNRRMHNKAWIADGRLAIVGGRNIGDEYFDAAEASNFRDLDIIGVGDIAAQAEEIFDEYWNSGLALPMRALSSRKAIALETLRSTGEALVARGEASPYITRLRERLTVAPLLERGQMHWSDEVRLISDAPEKAAGRRRTGRNHVLEELLPVLAASDDVLNISSPYFVPGEQGCALFTRLVEKGVRVRILTNSLAATDVAAVHGGYARYRETLLAAGVELFELKSMIRKGAMSLSGSSRASLHTKALTSDKVAGFVGSLNFDPRSASLNTEMGVIFAIPALVSAMDRIFEDEISPDMSFGLALGEDDRLIWHSVEQGRPTQRRHEPEASLARRLTARIVGLLPLESQL